MIEQQQTEIDVQNTLNSYTKQQQSIAKENAKVKATFFSNNEEEAKMKTAEIRLEMQDVGTTSSKDAKGISNLVRAKQQQSNKNIPMSTNLNTKADKKRNY